MADRISMGARREVSAVVGERYRAAGRREKGRILDELTATTGWHRKHAVRVLRAKAQPLNKPKPRKGRYGAAIKDALVALWEASDRVCGKRLKAMIPVLLSALVSQSSTPIDTPAGSRPLAPADARPSRCDGH